MFKGKYLKYKKKYLNLKGGSLTKDLAEMETAASKYGLNLNLDTVAGTLLTMDKAQTGNKCSCNPFSYLDIMELPTHLLHLSNNFQKLKDINDDFNIKLKKPHHFNIFFKNGFIINKDGHFLRAESDINEFINIQLPFNRGLPTPKAFEDATNNYKANIRYIMKMDNFSLNLINGVIEYYKIISNKLQFDKDVIYNLRIGFFHQEKLMHRDRDIPYIGIIYPSGVVTPITYPIEALIDLDKISRKSPKFRETYKSLRDSHDEIDIVNKTDYSKVNVKNKLIIFKNDEVLHYGKQSDTLLIVIRIYNIEASSLSKYTKLSEL